MRIRHLRLRINTDLGLHGTDIEFPDGLVVLRADNTTGKSTCIQSILVALGLEAMLTTNQKDLPLPHVMKKELFSKGDHLVNVIESDIFLEIENKRGEHIVVHRTVKGNRGKDLITVISGPALTKSSGIYNSTDYFVSRTGAAVREKGFHRFLAEFLEWNLPEVQTFDGRLVPLYIQCIFPYIAVEQKRGWASLIPPIPLQFRIREPNKRSIEFLLNLDANEIASKRIDLNNRTAMIEREWEASVYELQAMVKAIGGIVSNLPDRPITKWPPEILPIIQIPHDNKWLTLEEFIQNDTIKLHQLLESEIPRVNKISDAANIELSKSQEYLNAKEVVLSKLLNTIEMERGEARSIQTKNRRS